MSKYLSALIFFVLLNFFGTSNSFAQGQNESIEDYLEQLESYRKSGDEDDINRSLLQIAFLFWNKGKGQEAIKYFEESIKINEGIGNQAGAAHAYNNIGIIYSEQNDKAKALTNLEKALSIRKSLKDKSGISNSLLHIGIINYEQGNFDKAIAVLEECLKVATEIRSVMEITDSYLYLSQANEAAGNGEEALKYHKLYTQGVKFEGNDYINGLTQKFEADKSKLEKEKHYTALELEKKNKELEIIKLREREIAALAKARKNEIALLKKTKELQDAKLKEQEAKLRADRIFQTSLIAGIILVFLLAAVIAWAYFQKIKTNKLLTTQKREIEKKSIQLRVQNEKVKASEEKILQKNRELKAKNKKLIELNDEVGNLNNLILNDLNVPLAHIDDLVELVHNNVKEISTEQKQQINRIVESKKHLQALIKDMEEIQKIKAQIGRVATKEIDLNKVLQNVIDSTNKEEAEKKELVIHSNFEMNESLVKVDEKYVTQVFKNLLSNAAKFSPPGKKIYVNMTNKDGKFQTEIKDEGPGLSEEDKEKLFSKFQKLSSKPTAGEVSTGLGLSIVKEYTELLNGKVWCESELGKGSSFFVEFEALN